MGINKLSVILAQYFAKRLNYDEDQADILRYGFEVLIGEFIKLTVLFFLAFILRIFPYVLLITFTSVTYRFLSGGIHFNTYGRCFVFSLILILSLGKIGQKFANIMFSLFSFSLLVGAVFIISFIITLKYAPVDSENKPLSETKKRGRKKLSLGWLVACFIAVNVIVIKGSLGLNQAYIIAVLFGILFQALSLLPVVIKTVTAIDIYLNKISFKGGEKYV